MEKPINYTLLSQDDEPHPGFPKENYPTPRKNTWTFRRVVVTAIPILAFVSAAIGVTVHNQRRLDHEDDSSWPQNSPACPQFEVMKESSPEMMRIESEVKAYIEGDDFLDKSLKRMQGAIQIPTQAFDDMGPVEQDKRWDIFKDFHAYLEESFPKVYENLKVTKINTYGLLYEWEGSDANLKPYLFMAHQDVVPVLPATEDRWTYPPFSGHYDGRFIWGRGASDCKNNLIGILEALETLLSKGFIPKRTILAAFGFDEEISGPRGAKFLAQHLQDTLGKDSVELIIDEGGLGIRELYGATFALPGLGEKGYFDAVVTVETEGGHSSVPPPHTGIGILSQALVGLEDSPYKPQLTPKNPFFTTLQCAAEYGPEMDSWLRRKLKQSLKSKSAAKEVANYLAEDRGQRYLMGTSQAIDIISGGLKVNALPEKVYAVINHRIAVESQISDVKDHLISQLTSVAKSQNMVLDAWGHTAYTPSESTNSTGTIVLSDLEDGLEPSPVSPYDSEAYKVFSGTIKQVLGQDIVVAPSIMTGNTDTKYYWALTRDIYRFTPAREEGRGNAHTVDEKISLKVHVEGVKFYAQMILNGQ